MSAPVGTMIRTHLQANDAVQETIEWVEIISRLETEPVQVVGPIASPLELRRHRWWPIVVAIAAVVVLVGGMALLFQVTETDTPVITQPDPVPTTVPETSPTTVSTPPETSPTTVSTPPSVVDSLGYRWSRVPHDEAVFGEAEMWGVTEGGPGLVAVGSDGGFLYGQEQIYLYDDDGPSDDAVRHGFGDAVVWTSVDGAEWARVPHDDAVFGGDGEQQMLNVISGGPGLVAVGFDGKLDNKAPDAAVWTSSDGVTWSRVPHNESIFGGPGEQQMLSVTSGGPGLVAVGTDGYPEDHRLRYKPDEASDGAVWTSTDGFTWSRVPANAAVFGGIGHERMLSVTSGGPGLVAVGSVSGNGGSDGAVWTSTDGFTWSRVPHDEAVFGGQGFEMMRQVIVGGPGLVAVGSSGFDQTGWDAAVWTSPDGIAWTRVPHDEPIFGGDTQLGAYQRMFGVTVGDSGLVAVGRNWGHDGGAGVWVWED